MGALFDVALAQVVLADPVAIPLLNRFAAVVLEDSTSWCLPDELVELFRGCGGHHGGAGSMAACKLQVQLEMRRGQLTCSSLLDGRQADTSTPLAERTLMAHTLSIRDRGYVDVDRWIGQQAEWEVLVGDKQRFAMRALVTRVPEEVAQQRREYLRREALTHGRGSSHALELLAGWTIVLTTVPADQLSLEEAIVLLRLRWQIELLFKLWKQYGHIDEWRTKNAWRILCEVYAKLIALLLQHWLLVVGCWQDPHRSLVKAANAVRTHATILALALVGDLPLRTAVSRTVRAIQQGSRLNSRRDAPNASQLLLEGLTWSGKPLKKKKRR